MTNIDVDTTYVDVYNTFNKNHIDKSHLLNVFKLWNLLL